MAAAKKANRKIAKVTQAEIECVNEILDNGGRTTPLPRKAEQGVRTIADVNRDQAAEMEKAIGPVRDTVVPVVQPEPSRFLNVVTWTLSPQKDRAWGLVCIKEGNFADVYAVSIAKWKGEDGDVIGGTFQKVIAHPNGVCLPVPYVVTVRRESSSCECKGFINHGKCRHVEATIKLKLEGRI